MKRITLVDESRYLAISSHGNQPYANKPYYYHLEQVVDVLKEFGYTEDKYIISGYLHDILEDTSNSYNDIKKLFGIEIAEIIYCVTDELGRNRKERKDKTYPKITSNKDALIVKLADRIANCREGGLSDMYKKEYAEFKTILMKSHFDKDIQKMWEELDNLFEN